MIKKLIDADELKREMYRKCIDTDEEIEKGRAKWDSGLWIRYKVFEEAIVLAPRVEAEPVRHGRWIKNEQYSDDIGGHTVYECSKCGELYEWFDVPFHMYCRYCGAKMDEVEE